jgi:hypothetical protein
MRRRLFPLVLLVAALLLAAGAHPRQARAQAYWDQGGFAPNLYFFRPNNTGVRTFYPTGRLSGGIAYGFAWSVRGSYLTIRYVSGYTDLFLLRGYDRARDILYRTGVGRTAGLGPGPWFGCRSGRMPLLIARQLC